MGIGQIKGKPWHEHAADVLDEYHQGIVKENEYKPLWRVLYEDYCSMDRSYSPNVIFMHLIKTFQSNIKENFPTQEINRNVLLDYLEVEIENAKELK